MVYQWKSGARISVSAQAAGEVCEKLESEGNLSAGRLVEVSRPEDAPLHSAFEWNDTIAAEEFRKSQARCIINHLVVVSETKPPEQIKAFFNVAESIPTYDSFQAIIESVDKYDQLRQRVIKELESMQKRYAMVKGMESLTDVIDRIREAS